MHKTRLGVREQQIYRHIIFSIKFSGPQASGIHLCHWVGQAQKIYHVNKIKIVYLIIQITIPVSLGPFCCFHILYENKGSTSIKHAVSLNYSSIVKISCKNELVIRLFSYNAWSDTYAGFFYYIYIFLNNRKGHFWIKSNRYKLSTIIADLH